MNMTRTESIRAILLAMLVVGSAMSAAVAPAAATQADGMVGVPSEQVTSNVPEHAQDRIPTSAGAWQPQASDHAGDLQLEITTESARKGLLPSQFDESTDDLVLSFTDNVNHEGREVAVDASTLEETVGYRPTFAYGRHEDGSTWKRPITYEDGVASWEIPHFSTQDVTFDGEFSLSATPASDGDSFAWNTSDGGENLVINVTGDTNSEWDNESATGVTAGSKQSISVGGNTAPVAGDGNNPKLTVTGYLGDAHYSVIESETDGTTDNAMAIAGDMFDDTVIDSELKLQPTYSGDIHNLTVHVGDLHGSDYGVTVDVYLVEENPDGTYGEGTQIATWDPDWQQGNQTIPLDTTPSVTAGKNYSVEFISSGTDGDGANDRVEISTNKSADSVWMTQDGDGKTQYPDVHISNKSSLDNLEVSDGDGTTISFGNFSHEETKTKRVNLSLSSTELNWTGSGAGTFDWKLEMKERTVTKDPVVELNNESDGVSGTLADGETATLSISDSAIKEGENQLNVSVGDGSLSSDAPTPQADVNVTHDVVETQSIDFKSEAFSEKYIANNTWAEDTENAQFEVTWASDRVVDIREVEVRYFDENGNHQSTTTSPEYTADNGTLTVQLGDVPAGWTTEVRATGSKVQVENGEIMVLEATTEGNALDTKLEITNRSEGFAVSVGGTYEGHFLHHTRDESWSSPESFTENYADGKQKVRVPNGPEGGTFRLQTIPVEVDPKSGAVEVEVTSPAETEFRIRKGNVSGADEVRVGYYDTTSGDRYVLAEAASDDEIDSDVAESPVWFLTNDDDRIYYVEQRDSDATSSQKGGAPNPEEAPAPPTGLSLLIIPIAGLTVAGLWYGGRKVGLTGLRGTLALSGASLVVGVGAVEFVTARSVLAGLGLAVTSVLSGGVGAFLATLAVLLGLWQLEQRTAASVPWWVFGFAGVGSAVILAETVRPGSVLDPVSQVLGEVGAAVAIIGLVAGAAVLYRRQQAKAQPDTQVTLDVGDGGNN